MNETDRTIQPNKFPNFDVSDEALESAAGEGAIPSTFYDCTAQSYCSGY